MIETQIKPDMMIPDVVMSYPACRVVLDQFGLKGCGGPLGPHESLRFFAEAHEVDLTLLMDALNAAALAPAEPTPAAGASEDEDTGADQIYRPFFKAAIMVSLTAGCVWGASNLYQIGSHSSFFAVPLDWTLAHAHAQILGWVGLFIMGFAYQAFPRFRHTRLAEPSLAYFSLWLMIAGIALYVPAQSFPKAPYMLALGTLAGLLELWAVTIFLSLVFQAMHGGQPSSPRSESMVGGVFIMTALAVFWLQTALGVFLFRAMTTSDENGLVHIIATWMPPFRDLQIFGFIIMMIFGVSLRLLPGIYGLGAREGEDMAARQKRTLRAARRIYAVYTVSLLAGMICWVQLLLQHNPAYVLGLMASYAGLLATGILIVRQIGIFGPAHNADRSLKFLRASFVWLLVGLVMLNGMFPYNYLTGQTFSHAYLGSIRHAVTVGFISLMMMGVATRIVPTLRGLDPRTLPSLWGPFVLVNLGNGLRVATQITTDFTPALYSLMGISGFLEVTGLIWWAADLWLTMNRTATAPQNQALLPFQPSHETAR